AAVAMRLARALDLLEIVLDPRNALLDHAPIGFELGLARPAEKAEAAALPLEMGPRAHQPALLIGEMGMLDLKCAFAGTRPPTEDFEDQAGAVEHLGVPGFLEIALLHRRHGAIHHHEVDCLALGDAGDFLDLAFAEIGRGPNAGERHRAGLDDVEIDGAGKPNGLL